MKKHEIVEHFLNRSDDIITEIQARTLGEESCFPTANVAYLQGFFELYSQLAIKTSESTLAQVKTTQDVVKLLSGGKISIADAKELMGMMKVESDITDLKAMKSTLDAIAATKAI